MSKIIIGVCGGTASGKSSICKDIITKLSNHKVNIISQDNFYKSLDNSINVNNYNFDHPNAIDFDYLLECINKLKEGVSVEIPIYDFSTHTRLIDKKIIIPTAEVILVEGILIFNDERLRKLFDLKIFIETDSDLALIRRIQRDISDRNRNIDSIIDQYIKYVKPSYEEFVLPYKKYADIIIPNINYNVIAIDMMIKHIGGQLVSLNSFRD
jgi:uridine kinase